MAKKPLDVEALTHKGAKRPNIPTAELEQVMEETDKSPIRVAYDRRNRDLDPQLVWRGKDEQDWSDLIVQAPPLYIQEKIHPKVLIDDLKRQTREGREADIGETPDLFADFNGLPDAEAATEFYQHSANWTNRMILGDSLSVMASLAEREELRGKVQCIYIDPPYGIKFNSNFQWSTTTRDVKDGKADHLTREPEQVRAFRDTWRDGIHSYLTYLRDRLTVARDLLSESGSIFVQIGDENVHRVRSLMDEILGVENYISTIVFVTTSSFSSKFVSNVENYIIWYAKSSVLAKSRPLFERRRRGIDESGRYSRIEDEFGNRRFMSKNERENPDCIEGSKKVYRHDNLFSQGRSKVPQEFLYMGLSFDPYNVNSHWKPQFPTGLERLMKANRLALPSKKSIAYVRFQEDFPVIPKSNIWGDTQTGAFTDDKIYVVQTNVKVIERCILMSTDPGDLVLDPTCGSGTTAYVAEQWGRRWITVDTSRVALALARARVMGARYPYYLLTDSSEGLTCHWPFIQRRLEPRPFLVRRRARVEQLAQTRSHYRAKRRSRLR